MAPSGILRKLAWIFGSLLVVGVFVAIAFWPSGNDEWDAVSKRIDQLKTEGRARKFPRTVLRGEPRPGNAWEEYEVALKDAHEWNRAEDGVFIAFYKRGKVKVDPARVKRLLETRQNALEHLRLGAQRSDGQYFYDWERIPQMITPSVQDSQRLVNAAAAQAKISVDDGKTQDALDLLLDATAFSRDLATNGTVLSGFVGFANYDVSLEGLRHLIQSGKLTRAQLDDLARKLEIIDRDFPGLSPALSNEMISFGTYVQRAGEGGPLTEEWRETLKISGWSFAVNPLPVIMDAYKTKEALLERFAKTDSMTFAARKKEAYAITEDAKKSSVMVSFTTPDLLRMVVRHHETRTQLRLIRAATIFLSTGTTPEIADPFGDKLFYEQEGRKMKIWSVGSDGKNDNGTDSGKKPKDIVLEISQ